MMNDIIQDEQGKVTDTQKEIEDFLVNLEEDYEAFEADLAEAEEYVIEREGEIAKEVEELKEGNKALSTGAIAGITIGAIMVGLSIFGGGILIGRQIGSLASKRALPALQRDLNEKMILGGMYKPGGGAFPVNPSVAEAALALKRQMELVKPSVSGKLWLAEGGVLFTGAGLVISGSFNFWQESKKKVEKLGGLQAELASINLIAAQASALVETSNNVTDSFDSLTSEWSELQSNIKVMADMVNHEDVNKLKGQFEESSLTWQMTQAVSDVYKQSEENSSDESIELDFDEIDTEEEYEEVLKETYDVDEFIDLNELTEEELEEILLDLIEAELEEAA